MPRSATLLVIVDADAAEDRKAAELERVMAHWPAADRPAVSIRRADAVMEHPALLEGAAVAWLLLESTGPGVLQELAGLIGERHVPAMLSRTSETDALGATFDTAITVCPPATAAVTTCALLRTLMNQVSTLNELRSELHVMEAHRGELSGQINRMDEELRLAAQLQREFLPTGLPTVADLAFRVFFRPAGYVSGDIYDVSKLDEHHVGVFIADAVGHGVPAALMTMYIKRSLHIKVIDPSLPNGYRLVEPKETLAKLNHDLYEQQTGQVRFATACYALIDLRTHQVCIGRAGHPAPILLRANGQTEHIEPDGSLLGVFPEEQFEQVCFQLEPRDRLLLYSDGFETAFPEMEGDKNKIASDRYCREFEDLRTANLDEAIAHLQQKLDGEAGSLNQRDDLTMLCIAATDTPTATGSAAADQNERQNDRRNTRRANHPTPVA